MTDIVERLRRGEERLNEAADEIKRLTERVTGYKLLLDDREAEVERLRTLVDGSTVLDAGHLEDKVERLRAALQDIIERWPTEEGMDGAIQRARTALSL